MDTIKDLVCFLITMKIISSHQ